MMNTQFKEKAASTFVGFRHTGLQKTQAEGKLLWLTSVCTEV